MAVITLAQQKIWKGGFGNTRTAKEQNTQKQGFL